MDLNKIMDLVSEAAGIANEVGGKAAQVVKLIEAGVELSRVIRANIEEAAATLSTDDADALRERAATLALDNAALSEQVDAALRG